MTDHQDDGQRPSHSLRLPHCHQGGENMIIGGTEGGLWLFPISQNYWVNNMLLTNQGRSELELCPKRVPCSVMYYSSQGLFAQKVHHWIFSKSSAHSLHFIVWCSNVQYDFARCFQLNRPLLFALLYFLYCTAYFLSS